jgi:hypothetical protein
VLLFFCDCESASPTVNENIAENPIFNKLIFSHLLLSQGQYLQILAHCAGLESGNHGGQAINLGGVSSLFLWRFGRHKPAFGH